MRKLIVVVVAVAAALVLATIVAGLWRLGFTATPEEVAKNKADETAPTGDVWRLNETTTLYLVPSESENAKGLVRLVSDTYRKEYETSTTQWFGKPCILGSYPNQTVVVPYITGHGTGVAWHPWVLIRLGEDPVFQEMGVWSCHSVSRFSHVFELAPVLTWGTETGEPCLRFTHTSTEDGVTRVISGIVVVRSREADEEPFQLVPARSDDALACVELLASGAWGAEDFAKQVLETAHLEELNGYLEAQSEKHTAEDKLREAVKRHYAGVGTGDPD